MSQTIDASLQQANHYLEQSLFEEALGALDSVLTHYPHQPMALRLRGFALFNLQRFEAALATYQQLLVRDKQDIDALIKCGRIYLLLKQPLQALTYLNTAYTLEPNNAIISNLRGSAFIELKRPRAAVQCYAHAIKLMPHDVGTLISLGCALYELADYAQALACFENVLSINPNHLLGLSYRAFCLVCFNRHEEALIEYEKALQINPNHAITLFNQSLCLLAMGDYKRGWQKHEYRWQTEMINANRAFTQPLWLGEEDINGKTILLYAEQGLGDTIHFMRYVPLVVALGARVTLEVQPELLTLINIEGIEKLIARKENDGFPQTDYRCPLMSLPLAFHTELDSIPHTIPYVWSDADLVDTWRERLSPLTKPYKIGIAWSGNPLYKINIRRTMPLETLLSVQPPHIDFVSLQKTISADEVALLNKHSIPSFTDALTDFSQTAALIACLDAVITTDTAVAHLAGAMGKPTWLMLAFSPDWRWLIGRTDSPWYPTMTLFRQHAMWDWSQVIDQVKEKLNHTFE